MVKKLKSFIKTNMMNKMIGDHSELLKNSIRKSLLVYGLVDKEKNDMLFQILKTPVKLHLNSDLYLLGYQRAISYSIIASVFIFIEKMFNFI